jgi:hypothetical protein
MNDTTTKVKNYKGNNSFILKMKDSINRYGSLTVKQRDAVERIFNSTKEVKQVELTGDLKRIDTYEGSNSFVLDIKSKLKQYGKLSDKQISATIKQIDKEENQPVVRKMNVPAIGDTIKVGRKVSDVLKKKYDLQFLPIFLDITRVLGFSEKAVQFRGKLTIKRGSICTCCARTLTDEFSMLTRMGKTCAKHMGVEYITDASQAERFRKEYIAKVEEIGEMEFWVPKSQIKTWNGKHSGFVEMSNNWF